MMTILMATFRVTPSLVRSRFGRRLFALFVVCSLLPAVVLGILSFGTVTRQLRRASQERLEHATRLVGTAIPMTAFARKVLSGLPDPNVATAANNYQILQQFTNESNKAGGKIDVKVRPSLSLFGRYGFRNLNTDDQATIPLPSGGGGNGHIHPPNKQPMPRCDSDARLARIYQSAKVKGIEAEF